MRHERDIEAAVALADLRPVIVEGFVDFDRELSIIAVRAINGDVVVYPIGQNDHRDGILHRTLVPAPNLSAAVIEQATDYVTRLLEHIGYVGVLGLELFQVGEQVIGNEYAPRPHNSGHWSITGAQTSQFENHLRAITGLPLGATTTRGHVGMLNIIGTDPDVPALLAIEGVTLHLYGKQAKPGRKIGHLTVVADTPQKRTAILDNVETVLMNVLHA